MSNRYFGHTAAMLMLSAVLCAGCSRQPPQAAPTKVAAPPDGHERMLATLDEIRRKALTDNPFFQTASIAEQEAELADLSPGQDVDRFILLASLAEDYRRVGEVKQAVQLLEAAEALRSQAELVTTEENERTFLFEVGLTYLRLAETDNCIHCQTGESCILPIRGEGIHKNRIGSRKAIEYFKRVLDRDPKHLPSKWLLNIAAMTLGEYPDSVPAEHRVPPKEFEPANDFPRFLDVAGTVGLRIVNCGGGAIADDFDNDGLIDMLNSTWDPAGQLRYFRNTGNGKFEDRTEAAGLKGILGGINMVQADYNNDGQMDVLLVRGAWLAEVGMQPPSLLKNLGGGKFRDVTYDVGLGDVLYPSSTAGWGDYDLDGDVDLYIAREGPVSQLYRNDGDKGFTDVSEQARVLNGRFAKAAVWGDYNNDRYPDIYVSNLNAVDRLYRNNRNGTFTDVAEQLNVVGPHWSFPAWFWDVNNDGRLDIFVASYNTGVEHVAADYFGVPRTDEPDCLFLGTAEGGFKEVAADYGLTRVTQPMGSNFGDLDNDGFLDYYLGTGYPGYDGLMPNLMFHNVGGTRFEDVTISGGFGHLQKGHGTTFADLDNDGDQDVYMQMGGAYPGDAFGDVLFENPGFGNHWLRIRLVGHRSNRAGIGARIRADIVEGETRRSVYKWVNSGGSFGANPLQQHLGLGKADQVELLEIHWPASDTTQKFTGVPVDQWIEIHEGETEFRKLELKPAPFK